MNPTPIAEVVYRIKTLAAELDWEAWKERREARWPHAGQPTAIGNHNPSDRTADTAIHPDPVNTARADKIERTLRRVCRELEDEHAAGQQRQRQLCHTQGCDDPATRRGLCRACYEWQRRHGHPRRIRQTA